MRICFQLPDKTNYSESFLSCRRPPSPYPRPRRERGATTSKVKEGLIAKLKVIENYFKRQRRNRDASNTSDCMDNDGLYPLTRVAARQDSAVRLVEVNSRDQETQGRGWEQVVESLHREGINIAGHQVSVEERERCASGQCRCLGPLVRGR